MKKKTFFERFHCCVLACSLGISTRQLSQDGCAGFLNQSNKRHLLLFYMQPAERGSDRPVVGAGDERLKQEMTSIPSAEQLATFRISL